MISLSDDFKTLKDEVKEIQHQNYELMDSFRSAFIWMIQYCEKNQIPLPKMDEIFLMIEK